MPINRWLCFPIFTILIHDYSLRTKIEIFMALFFTSVSRSLVVSGNGSWLGRGPQRIRSGLPMVTHSAFGRPPELVAKVANGPSDV